MKNYVLTILFLSGIFTTYATDLIILKNGYEISCEIKKLKKNEFVINTKSGKYVIPRDSIAYVGFASTENQIAIELTSDQKCEIAELDAKVYHGKRFRHVALGFFLGPLAMMGTFIANMNPENGKYASINPNNELFDDPRYLYCYQSKARGRMIMYEAVGFGAMVTTLLAMWVFTNAFLRG